MGEEPKRGFLERLFRAICPEQIRDDPVDGPNYVLGLLEGALLGWVVFIFLFGPIKF